MRPRLMLRLLIGALVFAACGVGAAPTETFCDGISSQLGGCDPDRPKFSGTTCDEVAREFGREIDTRLLAIYRGSESREESKAVRVAHMTSVAAVLANLHLRRLGLIKECTAPAFLDVAEQQFSDELRAHAGEVLYDGPPVPYAEWRKALLGMLIILDQEEDASISPP
ncbi:MAG: hypothetical protein M3R57_00060 [Chloroflexota bacterium]|nr:hypothetical protein [Chloroflexota bacterium]